MSSMGMDSEAHAMALECNAASSVWPVPRRTDQYQLQLKSRTVMAVAVLCRVQATRIAQKPTEELFYARSATFQREITTEAITGWAPRQRWADRRNGDDLPGQVIQIVHQRTRQSIFHHRSAFWHSLLAR